MQEYEVRRIFLPDETETIRKMQLRAPEFTKHYPKHAEWLDMAIAEVLDGVRVAFGIFKYGLAPDRKLAVEIVGSIILKENDYTGVIELKNLYVDTGARLHGYGRAIHKKVVEFCAKAGYSAIQTEVPCDEIGTISFLLKMNYCVVDIEPSPYLDEESIYNMRCSIPPFYNGDVFDVKAQAIWVLKHYYGFLARDAPEDKCIYEFTATRSPRRSADRLPNAGLNGVAHIVDGGDPLTEKDVKELIGGNNAYLHLLFAERFSDDARALGRSLGLKLFDAEALIETFGGQFAQGAPQCPRDETTGMIVEIKPELFNRITLPSSRFSYFKGGPSGKYLKTGQSVLFHLDPTPEKTRNGICGFARIDSVHIGSAKQVWQELRTASPLFTEDEYVRFSRSKEIVIGFELSAFEEIEDIPIAELPTLLKIQTAALDQIGHRYIDAAILTKIHERRKEDHLKNSQEYDVALTFAGEDRTQAEDLAKKLKAAGVSVFYDAFQQADLWGKDLFQHLQVVYRDKARFCLILISKHYPAKAWTRHELKQAQARAFKEENEYILPLRLDDTEIPGLNETVGYIDLRKESMDTVVDLLRTKLDK